MDVDAQNYDPTVNVEDNSCYYNAGCMQAGYLEYYEQGYVADFDDGSCEIVAMFGCTDATALNYDPEANVDIDSCIEVVVGCVDVNAFNYDEEVNTADNSQCLYDAGCVGGPGNPYWANDICYSWVIEVDPYCCDAAWDDTCVELYEYCEAGTTTDIPTRYSELKLYPNPVHETLIIRCPSQTFTRVYDASGRIVVRTTTNKNLDLSMMPVGIYNVVVNYNGRSVAKTIVKQ